MHPKHRAHVLLPYTYTKTRASCFICDDFYKNFVAPLRMHLLSWDGQILSIPGLEIEKKTGCQSFSDYNWRNMVTVDANF